ncbi:sulfite exporter TauE/SafE family protein [Actinoplanes sp. NPDC023714]|uniref:sulfite exporter TauE/SafE family protein n=1 Tax=Actinoplanes sp. NPDC023714 TaxID=3154322 RepID=UPI0033FAD97B
MVVPIALVVGVFIGAVGVGGVGLPPALTWFAGLDPHTASGTASLSFLFTGLAGTLMYARHRAMPWRLAGRLTLGASAAALPGALVNGLLPDRVVLLPLGVFVTAAGAYNLLSRPRPERRPGRSVAVVTGAGVGFSSALTGTGGPVFLIPVLLALGVPAVEAVAAGQLIQLPLVAFATAGYAIQGSVDTGLGCLIGVIAAGGVVIGARIALRLKQRHLQRFAAVTLVGFGVLVLTSTLLTL